MKFAVLVKDLAASYYIIPEIFRRRRHIPVFVPLQIDLPLGKTFHDRDKFRVVGGAAQGIRNDRHSPSGCHQTVDDLVIFRLSNDIRADPPFPEDAVHFSADLSGDVERHKMTFKNI